MLKFSGGRTTWRQARERVLARRALRRGGNALGDELGRFGREEDGNAIILTLFMFVFMLIMAGLGIDLMRYEMERTHLQATLDSAVLAGAGAPIGSEVNDVKEIIEDYFTKNDMSQYLHDIDTDGDGDDDIETSLNATRAYAEASMTIDTYLMKLSGVDHLNAFGAAEAEVRTPKLEVSLVLDVSGSMEGTKLTNLQAAAKKFVTTILNGSDPGNTVISLIPFSWNVAPGREIYDALTVNETHDYSSCLRFYSSDYSSASINPSTAYDQQIYTSLYGGFDNLDAEWRSCFPEDRAQILPYSMSEADLYARINALDADGNTSAHIGMKWGAAMLDPQFASVFTALQAPGVDVVDDSLANIPSSYTEGDTLKIIVLMADGQNTDSYYFDENSSYRGANSPLYKITFQEMEFEYGYFTWNVSRRYTSSSYEGYCGYSFFECIYEPADDAKTSYFVRNGSDYYDVDENDWLNSHEMSNLRASEGYVGEERLTWEQAWGMMSPDWYGNLTGNWGPWNDYRYSERESGGTKDTRMQAICSATKTQGVVVYTIGYSISSGGNAETQLRACASSGNHYYPTNGSNISAAFSSIASNVQNLRLTQ
ncbi:MAG: VWA domain-containing protein [Roseovarius sp.]|uniref:VWA domain-containing protein n=1 Tax=Roseovarius sp. TaxID=1486281 RepID=UPI0032EB2D55